MGAGRSASMPDSQIQYYTFTILLVQFVACCVAELYIIYVGSNVLAELSPLYLIIIDVFWT